MLKTINRTIAILFALSICLIVPVAALSAEADNVKIGADMMMKGSDMMMKKDKHMMMNGQKMIMDGHSMMKPSGMMNEGGMKMMMNGADMMKNGADMMMQQDEKTIKEGEKMMMDGKAMMKEGEKTMQKQGATNEPKKSDFNLKRTSVAAGIQFWLPGRHGCFGFQNGFIGYNQFDDRVLPPSEICQDKINALKCYF